MYLSPSWILKKWEFFHHFPFKKRLLKKKFPYNISVRKRIWTQLKNFFQVHHWIRSYHKHSPIYDRFFNELKKNGCVIVYVMDIWDSIIHLYLNIFGLHKIFKVLLNSEGLQLFMCLYNLTYYHFPPLTACIPCSWDIYVDSAYW